VQAVGTHNEIEAFGAAGDEVDVDAVAVVGECVDGVAENDVCRRRHCGGESMCEVLARDLDVIAAGDYVDVN
jgi:hypothetical protein